jgi:hypothetical protein
MKRDKETKKLTHTHTFLYVQEKHTPEKERRERERERESKKTQDHTQNSKPSNPNGPTKKKHLHESGSHRHMPEI